MPSLGIHLLVADDAFSRLAKAPDQPTRDLGSIVRYYPNMASLGAIGPDLFYYLGTGPAISAAVADVFHFLHQISAIVAELGTLAQQAGMPNIANRIKQIGDTVTLVVGTAQSGLLGSVVVLNEVITGSHLFNPSAQQEEKPETDWNWGDILHDRVSGSFATKLLNSAVQSNNYPLIAYCCGYMTHLATDFVGHPYVNTVVGGPARGWNMRHTIAEKFMDASVFNRQRRDINTSRLHARFTSLADSPQLQQLCAALANQIDILTHDTSLGYQLPQRCSDKEIKQAFDSMCSLFRLVTEDSYVPQPQGPGITIPPLPGQAGSLVNAVTQIPPPGRPNTITDWLRFLLALLLLVPALMVDVVRFLTDVAIGVVTYPFAAAVYVVQSFLYYLYRQVRWFLVISGVAFPCTDELSCPLGLQFVTSRGSTDDNYPHVAPVINKWQERIQTVTFSANNYAYLDYPATAPERPRVAPSFYAQGAIPELFMHDLARDDNFIANWLSQTTPAQLRALVNPIPPVSSAATRGFGSAADLSVLLLQRADIAANINLDSDRGYAYKQWRCNHGEITAGNIVNETFI